LYKCPTSYASCNVNRRLGIDAKERGPQPIRAAGKKVNIVQKCPFLGFRGEAIQFFIYRERGHPRIMV
jgi:hypothetical protein